MFTIKARVGRRNYNRLSDAYQSLAVRIGEGFEAFTGRVEGILREHLDAVIEEVTARNSGAWPGGTTDTSLSMRSGEGINQIHQAAFKTGRKLKNLSTGFRLEGYMAVHETGGTISGKGKMLTIPLPPALNANGTPKRKSAREWENTFIGRSTKGNLLIFQREGASITPLYILKPQVTIKPRLGLRDTFSRTLPYYVDKVVDALAEEMQSAVMR